MEVAHKWHKKASKQLAKTVLALTRVRPGQSKGQSIKGWSVKEYRLTGSSTDWVNDFRGIPDMAAISG